MSDSESDSGTIILARPFGSSKQSEKGQACIILLHPPGPDIGRRTPLTEPCYVFGRDEDVDMVIGRSSVSRRHAQMVRDSAGNWSVEDRQSTNGTFVNEERISTPIPLRDGDQIRFGDAIFKFLAGTNIESAYHEEIYRMTIADGLTGVHNKRYFLEFLDRELASSRRHDRPLTLVMLDIDHFKAVNDDRGHLAGDAVLKQLANRIQPRIRREDLFARYGGEEFAAVLTVTPLEGGLRFAEHIRQLIAGREFSFESDSFPLTVSLGVATLTEDMNVKDLIQKADENLYEAKHQGRNRVIPSADGA